MGTKFVYRPNGAYKLLIHLLYGQYKFMAVMPRGIVELQSIRKLARLLGTQSYTVNRWLSYLEDNGYIESLQYSPNKRSAKFKIRETSNVY